MRASELKGRRAISYARWSSGRQSRGSSSARQQKLAHDYARQHGLILDDQIVDDGISAFTGDNLQAGLGRFLEGVEAGRIPKDTVLLIENMDRFSRRNPVDALPKFLEVLALGLTIVTLQDELIHTHDAYSGDPTAIMRSLLSMQLAYEESKKKSIRARETWDNRLLRISGGQRLSMSKVPFWIDRKSGQLNHRAEDAKRVFELALAGNGASNITRMLNSECVPSPRGGSWGKSVVQDVLKSKAAIGTLVVRGQEQPDYFPQIVSKDNWLAIQNRAAQQRHNPKASTDANLFSRLLKCGGCAGPVSVSTAHGRYRYARCDNQVHHRNDCKMGSWPYNKLEELIVSRVGVLLSLPPDPLQRSSEDTALLEEIQSLKTRLERTVALSIEAETTETSSLYRSAADGLARQIEAAKGRLARLEEEGATRVIAGEMIEDMQQAWEEAQRLRTSDRPRLRAMIAAVVDEVRLMPFDIDDFNVAQVKLKTMREPHNVFLEPDSIRGRKAGVPMRPSRRKPKA